MLRHRLNHTPSEGQRAAVFVDGVEVGTWYTPPERCVEYTDAEGKQWKCDKRWLGSDFEIPSQFTRNKKSVRIRIQVLGEGPRWNEFYYWVYSLKDEPRGGEPVAGAVVYLTVKDSNGVASAPLSTVTDSRGNYTLDLSHIRTADRSAYFSYDTNTDAYLEDFLVRGSASETATLIGNPTNNDQPVPTLILGRREPLPGDLDGDCDVDLADVMMVAVIWNTHEGDVDFKPAYDFDGDGRISIADIMYIAAKWNTRCAE